MLGAALEERAGSSEKAGIKLHALGQDCFLGH